MATGIQIRLPWGFHLSRLDSGYGAATYQGWNEWKPESLVAIEELGFEGYGNRRIRYGHYEAYYFNVAYDAIKANFDMIREDSGFYRDIRSIYNPVARLVDTYANKIYPGLIRWDDMAKGAIPIKGASDEVLEALRRIWKASKWQRRKGLFVRRGALLGDSPIKIVTDRVRGRVMMQPIHPGKLVYVERDDFGEIKMAIIEYMRSDNLGISRDEEGQLDMPELEPYKYTEVITPDRFYTFKNDEPFPFYQNADGRFVDEWKNIYGFVPIAIGAHKESGLTWAMNSFHESIRKYDELNDLASLTHDAIRRNVEGVYFFSGVTGKQNIKNEQRRERDEVMALYAKNEHAKATALRPDLDINSALKAMIELTGEIEKDNPILAFPTIRSQVRDVSGIAVEVLYSDASEELTTAAGNYDETQVEAHRMGMAIGAIEQFDGFESFSEETRFDEDESGYHMIGPRPMIADKISQKDRVTFLISSNSPRKSIWRAMDYEEADVELMEQEAQDEQQRMMEINDMFADKTDNTNDSGGAAA